MTWLAPEDLDAAWFEGVLAERYPGVRVAAAERTGVDEGTNVHVRATLTYDEAPAGAPDRVFVKLPPADPDKARLLGSARMGKQEARFYRHLAPTVDLRVPVPYGVVLDDDGAFALVIEDLAATGCTPLNLVGVARDAAAGALEDLARLHVRYEDPGVRQASPEVAWIRAPRLPEPGAEVPPNMGQILLRKGIDEQADALGPAYVAVAERWVADPGAFQRLWWDAPLTVIHGDAHPGNLFDDHGRVGFLDWGLITQGDPLREVSYFLCLALDVEVRRAAQEELWRHYLDVRAALGGRPIDFDEAWARHRLHAAYTVPASCQALVTPADASPGARAFSELFLGRAIAAVEDLEVAVAVDSALAG